MAKRKKCMRMPSGKLKSKQLRIISSLRTTDTKQDEVKQQTKEWSKGSAYTRSVKTHS